MDGRQNSFGWLYRARAVLSMLFSGYSCSADPFSRYLAGQSVSVCWDQKFLQVFHKLYKVQPKLTELVRDPTWTGAKTALAGCIELEQCFQCYLAGIAVLRTRSRDILLDSLYLCVGAIY